MRFLVFVPMQLGCTGLLQELSWALGLGVHVGFLTSANDILAICSVLPQYDPELETANF